MAARKLNYLIFFTIAGSCFSIIILGACIGTNNWYTAEVINHGEDASLGSIKVTINYGLFGGTKYRTINNPGVDPYDGPNRDLKIVSSTGDNIAMYSCGTDGDKRKKDLETWLNPTTDQDLSVDDHEATYCGIGTGDTSTEKKARVEGLVGRSTDHFLNFGLWITTILFLLGGMIFSAISGGLALYNTFQAPSQPIFSVFGLYIWNGIAASCTLMAIIMWGAAFGSGLKDNSAVNETIGGTYTVEKSSLGYSFWIAILAECLCWANIGILRYRTWSILKSERNVRVVDDKLTSPDHLLF